MGSARRMTTRVFVDSSVLMAAAISPTGSARELIQGAFSQEVALSLSSLVLEETERNLANTAPAGLPFFKPFVASLPAELIKPSKEQVLEAARIVVLKDAAMVAGAVAAPA